MCIGDSLLKSHKSHRSHAVRSYHSRLNRVSMNYSWFVKPQTFNFGNVEVLPWVCLRVFFFHHGYFHWSNILTAPSCILGQLWEIVSVLGLKEMRQQITENLRKGNLQWFIHAFLVPYRNLYCGRGWNIIGWLTLLFCCDRVSRDPRLSGLKLGKSWKIQDEMLILPF